MAGGRVVDLARLESSKRKHAMRWGVRAVPAQRCVRAVLGWPQQAYAQSLRRLQVAADSGDCLGFAFRDRKHLANPSPAALRLEQADGAWHVRKCRGGQAPSRSFALAMH